MHWLRGVSYARVESASCQSRQSATLARTAAAGQEPSFTAMFAGPAAGTPRAPGGRLALWPVGAAKRKRVFTRARKATALHVRSAIMPILSEVAPYDFRP
ncbi:hypothetical protein CS8_045550 [Cupriavidus sp. 8B]